MSHISTYEVKILDTNLFLKAAKAQGHSIIEGHQVVKQFGRNQVDAIASVKLQGWRYSVAITADGELKYDHFGSEVHTMPRLGKLVQRYNEEVIMQNVDYSQVSNAYKEALESGDIKLVMEFITGKRVEAILGKDGKVRTEVFGAKGEECIKMTTPIREALGVLNTDQNTFLKDSYYESEVVVNELPSGYCG